MRINKSKKSEDLNFGFGQYGSAFIADTNLRQTNDHDVIVAITIVTDAVFAATDKGLISVSGDHFISSDGTSPSMLDRDSNVIGGVTLPAGMTIYGRFTGLQLDSGSVICYFGN